ncbi:MAG: TonB-dependent receptor plug domain-containing protein [Melioribacteraceae bacterium]|nr:TonB-dependent receptor plug domain-containing protein [Melioribacteraceae bacterium]
MTSTRKQFILYLSILIILLFVSSNAQQIKIQADNLPLSEVLVELRNSYGLQTSFDHQLISSCIVSISGTYPSSEAVISELLKNCDLTFEEIDGVFIIFEKPSQQPSYEEKYYYYSGQIVDEFSTESLPYSSIQTPENIFVADAGGNFSFRTKNSAEKISISHIGYYLLDTVLTHGSNQNLKLLPSAIGLHEIIVSSNAQISNAFVGTKAGLLKLNNKIASFLPGNNNNTVLNLLRLQPGILAAAEQYGSYIIRGSYRGEVLIEFDGIPLFSSSSLNNEIGIVNPLIIKDVEVYKGAYQADRGDRIGGIISMSGNNGNPRQFKTNLNLNTQTLSGVVNIPIAEKFSLLTAFRQSYTGVFNWNEVNNNPEKTTGGSYFPDYTFSDMNIKFSHQSGNGENFFLSLLGSKDVSSYNYSEDDARGKQEWEGNIDKIHLGGSASYNKNWKESGKTKVNLAYSQLETNSYDRLDYSYSDRGTDFISYYRDNTIEEISVKAEHQLPTLGNNTISIGAQFISNRSNFAQDTVSIQYKQISQISNRFSGYVKDNITFANSIELRPSIKIDYPTENKDFYVQPQIDLLIKPIDYWSINLGWSKHKQYVTEMALIDDLGNYYYFWGISDNTEFPVVSGMHNLIGVSYQQNGFIFNAEGFYKTSSGLSRFYMARDFRVSSIEINNGKSRAYGVDLLLKKEISKHDFWVSYTLSRTEEDFIEENGNGYVRAPQDQLHEIKLAAIFNFNPWYLSLNYVYGSGLYYSINLEEEGLHPYQRMDIAVLYKLNTDRFYLETGLSIVNLFDYQNIGHNGFSHLPGGERVYISGIPFTPSLFLNIGI